MSHTSTIDTAMERASGVFQSLKESVGLFTAGFVDKGDHYELKGL